MSRFYISLFLILYQAAFSNSLDCSSIVCPGEKCNITRNVAKSVDTLTWRRDGVTIISSSYQDPNLCFPNPSSTDYAEYCFEDSTNRIYILEILYPENHAGSIFSNPSTANKTTINLIVIKPDNLSSDDITTNIPSNITKDIVSLSVTVPCSKPQPTFTWNFNKSTRNISIENSQISTDSTGCASSLMKQISTLNVADLDSNITETSGDIDITVDVKFGDCKTVSKTVTAQFIVPVPKCNECCRCYYNLIVLIIIVALIVLVIIVVIIHFRRREAKKCGTVYWALNILLIIGVLGCVILAIVQIVYLTKASEDCCQDTCQDTCQEKAGYDAAIAFVVIGFIKAVLGIVVLILRLKNRDQKKETTDTEMKPGSEKEKNRTSDRPLPAPKRT